MKAVGGNRGYIGYSESVRSAEAKRDGIYPKTQFCKEYGVSAKMLKALCDRGVVVNSEWHHTSKFGNKTQFYKIADEYLFYILTGDIAYAFELYHRRRNYEMPYQRNNSSDSIDRKRNFLKKAENFAFENELNIGDCFVFHTEKIAVISTTKHRKYPVCAFARE